MSARRYKVLLIVGGQYHDFDLARRTLLGLLGEHALITTECCNDFHDVEALSQADLLITYTANVFPDAAQREVLEQFLRRGGRWLAIHGSAAYTEFRPPAIEFAGIRLPGLTDTPDREPEYMNLLGCRFVSHLAQQPIKVEPVSEHPLVKGLPPFEVVDEPYILEMRGECEVLLASRYTGEAPGYVEGPWLEDEVRPQALLHRVGEGQALYVTLGHCCGPYDLRPFIDEMPAQPGPWVNREYLTFLRRSICWGVGLPLPQ